MAGDGVSMPTQLAQLGSVAKTQAQSQQASQPATSFADQLSKKESLKAQRVKEMQESEKGHINTDEDQRRKKKKKRHEKKFLRQLNAEEVSESGETPADEEGHEEEIGLLVDLRA